MQPIVLVCVIGAVLTGVYSQYGSNGNNGTPAPSTPVAYRVVSILSGNFLKGSSGNFSGFIVDYLNALRDNCTDTPFTYTLSLQPDGQYGSPGANGGQWSGLVGSLQSGAADVAAADLSVTYNRGVVVDFVIPYLTYSLVQLVPTNAGSGALKVAVVAGADQDFLQSSQDPVIVALNAQVQANLPQSVVATAAAGVALVQQGGWTVIGEDLELCGSQNVTLCPSGTTYSGAPLKQGYYSLTVPSGSPARNVLSLATEKCQDRGIVATLLKKWGLRGG